ncbi:MAG: hypothetical protein OEV94_00530 [Deltaproteobacteria bacterium]|nr:hypothetical protein [Deltaproteobacteria bacterium]
MNALKQSTVSFFVHIMNVALDSGKFNKMTKDDIVQHIEEGDLMEYLDSSFGKHINLEFIEADQREALVGELQCLAMGDPAISDPEMGVRTWGIQNNGLCLLIAWGLELIQLPQRRAMAV